MIRRVPTVLSALLVVAAPAFALEVGQAAPDFEARTVQGQEFSLARAQKDHRAVVVLFLSTLCPYSNSYNDLIRAMATDFARKDVLFVGIHSDRLETAEEIRVHARKHEHSFPMIPDGDTEVARLFGARRTPEAFLLDAAGKLRYRGRIASKIGTPDLRHALDALLAGRKIQPEETKAFGCAIRLSRAGAAPGRKRPVR